MKKVVKPLALLLIVTSIYACGKKMTFEEQITNDVTTRMGTGICDSIPSGAVIKNVKVGQITPIGETGLIDVALEYDFEINQQATHKSGAVLYSKTGSTYYLEALGGCDYKRKK